VIEALPTVLQATSLVSARSGAGLVGTMRALFPAASITGAPKVRTMEIIRDLEDSPRGVYCGAIGALFPDGRSQFNVSIRTLVIDRDAGQAEYGVGSGIVWDSEADDEYRECLLKARVLEHRPEPFEIVESLLWTPDAGYALLERHQERLQATCAYFGFPVVSLHRVLPTGWPEAPGPLKVPMLVDRHGRVRIEHGPAPVWPEGMRVAFAREPVDPSDPFLFHKTTRRHQHEKARAGRPGYDEVLLWNPDRELTEATTANVVALFNGKEYTPPVECGLLAGTLRSDLLARGELTERAITLEELRGAEAIYLINSVRGRVQVEIDWSTFPAS
ncbi:MAG TPA: chorismate-binding protein, partial [bacterium]|nr:chorismate-binding protein [bacterium]